MERIFFHTICFKSIIFAISRCYVSSFFISIYLYYLYETISQLSKFTAHTHHGNILKRFQPLSRLSARSKITLKLSSTTFIEASLILLQTKRRTSLAFKLHTNRQIYMLTHPNDTLRRRDVHRIISKSAAILSSCRIQSNAGPKDGLPCAQRRRCGRTFTTILMQK
jgi:hypothetical protein